MSESVLCVHCGADCGKHPVISGGKAFCCNGCKTVYELLDDKKLYSYYEIANTPGIRVDIHDFGNKYAYLDHANIREKLLDFNEGEISRVSFYIPVIHCSSCIWLLENLHTLNPGIVKSSVNFVKKRVSITFNETKISLRQLVELLASIHYIPQITLEDMDKKTGDNSSRKLIYKIGVAGFAFGNTMLLSFPEYLPGSEMIDENFRSFFGFLNFLLALPVMFYSATDYLLSGFKNLYHKIINIDLPISIGIIAIFLESSYQIFSGTGTGYMDSLAGLVFFLLIGKWYQTKTYKALSFERDYKSYFPVAVTKLVNREEQSIPLEELRVGDLLLIRNEELIPADAVLIKGNAKVDYSFVTGESAPVQKNSGDSLYAGGKQLGSAIEVKIEKEVLQSRLTQLWNQNQTKSAGEKKLTDLMDNVSKYFTIVVLSISAVTGIFWLYVNPQTALYAFTSVLIVACPCALALSIPFSFGNTMRLFGRKGFYLKKTDVVEALTKIDTIVFDKTGTITRNNESEIRYFGTDLDESQMAAVRSLARQSSHPASQALYRNLPQSQLLAVEKFSEIPAKGISGLVNNQMLIMGNNDITNAPENVQTAGTLVHLNLSGNYMGYFSINNKYRHGLADTIAALSGKFDLHLISGDNETEKERLGKWFPNPDKLHFNQSPADKLHYIKELKAIGKHVMMIGDGLNDAGALNESNVGISIADDIYHFSPACDAILESGRFTALRRLIDFSKSSLRVVRISFVISFLYNVIGISFAVQGLLSPIIAAILMPLSSVTVVAFVTAATTLAARRKLKSV